MAQAVLPGSVEMFEHGAARELSLQRLRHGVGLSSEVRAAEARCGIPFGVWMAGELATGQFRGFLRRVPGWCRAQLAARIQRGVELAIDKSVGMAREHAARRIQWAHRCSRLRQLLCAHGTALAQLESWKEARKTERKAVKARARGTSGLRSVEPELY